MLDWRITEPFMYWCGILWRTLELNSVADESPWSEVNMHFYINNL